MIERETDMGTAHSVDIDVKKNAQRLLLEAGYKAADDWIYIDDLVRDYRESHAGRGEMLRGLEEFLGTTTMPVTRADFIRFAERALADERAQEAKDRHRARLEAIYSQFGVAEHGAGHEALALRIVELEKALTAYAERLRAAERAAAAKSASPIVPFLIGVAIGDAKF